MSSFSESSGSGSSDSRSLGPAVTVRWYPDRGKLHLTAHSKCRHIQFSIWWWVCGMVWYKISNVQFGMMSHQACHSQYTNISPGMQWCEMQWCEMQCPYFWMPLSLNFTEHGSNSITSRYHQVITVRSNLHHSMIKSTLQHHQVHTTALSTTSTAWTELICALKPATGTVNCEERSSTWTRATQQFSTHTHTPRCWHWSSLEGLHIKKGGSIDPFRLCTDLSQSKYSRHPPPQIIQLW